jgi:predicted AAA+ superfamily ATPase
VTLGLAGTDDYATAGKFYTAADTIDLTLSAHALDAAKVIQLVYPTTELIPLIKPNLRKSPRLQFLDTGLVNHVLNIQGQLLGLTDLHDATRGGIIPHLITQHLISLQTIHYHKPHFWVREKSQASSEVDLVFAYKEMVIPIEIKAGPTGSLKSLHQFMDRAPHPYAIRIYAGKFKMEEAVTDTGTKFQLMNLPYYLGTMLPQYIKMFMERQIVS